VWEPHKWHTVPADEGWAGRLAVVAAPPLDPGPWSVLMGKKAGTPPPALELTAHHEAAHAAVAAHFGYGVLFVTIRPSRWYLGCCAPRPRRKPLKECGAEALRRAVLIALAGDAGEQRFRGRRRHYPDRLEADWVTACCCAIEAQRGYVGAVRYVVRQWHAVRQLVRRASVWSRVRRVARALLERPVLGGSDVRILCKPSRCRPLKPAVRTLQRQLGDPHWAAWALIVAQGLDLAARFGGPRDSAETFKKLLKSHSASRRRRASRSGHQEKGL
jgi:hypothetical protein